MELLEERIRRDGRVMDGDILKVDCFLNHQIDVGFLDELAAEFHRRFGSLGVNKILTIEASGIAIGSAVARAFGAPLLFAKKTQSLNIGGEVYSSRVASYTTKRDYDVYVSRRFLGEGDRVLIIDDFIANGCALDALTDLCRQAGAVAVGAGIVIEKAYQGGANRSRAAGLRVESLACITSMDSETGSLEFAPDAAS